MDPSHPAIKNFEVEDSHPDGGSKGLMEKMKDATRRLKDKVKGTIGHGGRDVDVDEFEYSSDSSNNATLPEAAHPQYAHDSSPATTYKGTTDYPTHGHNPDASEQRESAPALGAVSGDSEGFHSSNATGIPIASSKDTSGNWQKGAASKHPPTLNTTSLSPSSTPAQGENAMASPLFASATPSPQDKDTTSIDSIDTSSGGFGAFSRPAGTGPYTDAATSPGDQEVQSTAGLKELLDVKGGSGLLSPDEAARQEGQGQIPSAMGQKSAGGSFMSFGGGRGKEDRGIARTDDFELGRGNDVPKVMTSVGAGVVFGGDGGWSGSEEAIGREDAGCALHGETDKLEEKSLWQDVKESAAAGQAHGVSQVVPLGDNESTIQKLGAAAAVTAEKAKVETGFGAEGSAPEKKAVRQRMKDSVTSAAAVVGTAVGSLGAAMGYYGPEGEEDSGSESEDGAVSAQRRGNDDVAGGGETIRSRLSKGVVLAKDTVVASTAVAITAASGVTSTIANKVGYGQQQPQGEKGEKLASVGEKVELGTGEGEGGKLRAESYLSSVARKLDDGKQAVAQRLGYGRETQEVKVDSSNAGLEEKVDQQSGGLLSSMTKTIGDGKEAVAQRLNYGGGGKKVEGDVGPGGVTEAAQEKSEGYLSSVARTIGEGKDAVAQRLGYGDAGQKVEQDVGQRGGLVSGEKVPEVKSGGGVVGAVAGTVGSLAGTVGGVKDSVVKSMGYGTKVGEGEGVLTEVKNEGNESVSPAGGTWMESAYSAASNVAGMAVKAKDAVAEKVGVGKGSSGGSDVPRVQQQHAENVPGAVGLPNTRNQQASTALANVKESVLSTAESGKETVANALGYGSSPAETGGVAVQSDEQGGGESKGLMQSMYNTVASTAGSVKGAVATRLGFGGNETNLVVSEPETMAPDEPETKTPEEVEYIKQVKSTAPPTSDAASGYDKVRADLSNIKQAEKVAGMRKVGKDAEQTHPNVEAAKYLVDEVRESFGTRQ